jgi:hypothetical protein
MRRPREMEQYVAHYHARGGIDLTPAARVMKGKSKQRQASIATFAAQFMHCEVGARSADAGIDPYHA